MRAVRDDGEDATLIQYFSSLVTPKQEYVASEIELLPSSETQADLMAELEYFRRKLIAACLIPTSYFGVQKTTSIFTLDIQND